MFRKLSTVLSLLLLSACTASGNMEIQADQLPETARQLIDEFFPNDSIKSVKIEKRASLVQYEVRITGKIKLQFSKEGIFTQCECGGKRPVPENMVPRKISEFIEREFKGCSVVNLEHDSKLWEVVLDNGVELDFNESLRIIDVNSNDD